MSSQSPELTEAIDAQFAPMANDEAYWALSLDLGDEFARSDWEALMLADEDGIMIISLEPKLEKALVKKSRDLNATPEALVVRLIRLFVEGWLLLPESELAEGITVREYLGLSEAEEAALWERWSEEARGQVKHIIAEASPDALPPG